MLAHIPLLPPWLTAWLALGSVDPMPPGPTCPRGVSSPQAVMVPRAPLLRPALPDRPCSYGLMRQTSALCAPHHVLESTVCAGCCEPLLVRGSSRRDLCPSVPACLAPYPGSSWSASTRFFLHDIGLPPVRTGSALSNIPCSDFSTGRHFGAAVMPSCSGPQVCSPPRSLLPLRQPPAVGQPWFLRPSFS